MHDDGSITPERIGPYRILRKLGAGGMADVYLGLDEASATQVAVKVLPLDMSTQKQLVRRFQREFETCRRIDHPNVVRVFGSGELECGFYYAMEYLPHPDLAQVLGDEAPLPLRRALGFARDMAAAFTAYHPLGLVHRDLKPANVIVAEKDRLVLVDFGLVKDQNVTQMTRTGAMLGTPQYMSPELVKGTPAGAPSDVFQLGLILFECLTGVRAFDGDSVMEIAAACIGDPHPALSSLRPDLPPGIGALIDDCLAKAEEERPRADALLARIDGLLADESATPASPPPSPPSRTAVTGRMARKALASSSGRLRRSGRNLPPSLSASSLSSSAVPTGWGRWLGGALAGLSLLAAAAWLLRPAPPFQMSGLEVRSGLRSVVLSWTSTRPYPTVVELVDAEGGSATRWTGTVSSAGRHGVRIPRLRPGRSYHWWVLFPDGTRSLRQKIELHKLDLNPLSVSLGGDGRRMVRWTSNLLVRAKLRLTPEGRAPRDVLSDSPPGTEHAVAIPESAERLSKIEIVALDGNDEEEGLDLGPWLAERARAFVRTMVFDADEFVKSMGIDARVLRVEKVSHLNFDADYVSEEKRLELEGQIEERFKRALGAHGALAAVKRIRDFLPFVLENPLLDEELWRETFAAVNAHNLCLQHFLTQKLHPPAGLFLDGGFLDSRLESAIPGARVVDLAADGKISLETKHPLRPSQTTKNIDFLLGSDLGSRRAELFLRVDGFSSSTYVEAQLNGKGSFIIRPRDTRKLTGKLFVGIPHGWLRSGANSLRLDMRLAPGCLGLKNLKIRRLVLRLAP